MSYFSLKGKTWLLTHYLFPVLSIIFYPIFGWKAVNTVNTYSSTNAPTESPQPSPLHRSVDDESLKNFGHVKWEKYTMTIILCSSILTAVVILTAIYIVQICRKKVISLKQDNLM